MSIPVGNHFERAAAYGNPDRNQPINENLQSTARRTTFLALKIIVPLAVLLLAPIPFSLPLVLASFALISKLENSCCQENLQTEPLVRDFGRRRAMDLDDLEDVLRTQREQNFLIRVPENRNNSRSFTLRRPQEARRSPIYIATPTLETTNTQQRHVAVGSRSINTPENRRSPDFVDPPTLEMVNSPVRHVAVGTRATNTFDGLPRPYSYRPPHAAETLEERNLNEQYSSVVTRFAIEDNPATTSARPVAFEAPPALQNPNITLAQRVDTSARPLLPNLFGNEEPQITLEERNTTFITQPADARMTSARFDVRERSTSFDSTTSSSNVAVGGRSSRRNPTLQPLDSVEEKPGEEERVAVGSRRK